MVYDMFQIKLKKKKGKKNNKHCPVTECPLRVSLGMFQQCRAAGNNHDSPSEARGETENPGSPV